MTIEHEQITAEDSSANRQAFTTLQGLRAPRAPAEGESKRATSRAVVYLRVSSQRQLGTARDVDADGNSIATQRQFVERKAAELGTEIVQEFVEPGTSAQTIAKRMVFRQMLAYLDEHPGEIDRVIIYARSRAFRNLHDAVLIEHDLREQGVELVSATENFGTDEDMAMLLKVLTDGFNHVQVRHSGRDIPNKMAHKAQQGGTLGRAKLGYLNVRKSVDGYLVNTIDVDPERAPQVRWAFEAYATGEWTIATLQQTLEAQGFRSRPTRSYGAAPISTSKLATMLRDPYYTGVLLYKGELIQGRHPALISVDLFQRVQDVASRRVRPRQQDRVHTHYLRGRLRCGDCAKRGLDSYLVYNESRGRNGTYYPYYGCSRRSATGCRMSMVPVGPLQPAIEQMVRRDLTLGDEFVSDMRSKLEAVIESQQQIERDMAASMRDEMKKLEVREERLLDLAADGDLPTAKVRARLADVQLERRAISERLTRVDATLEHRTKTVLAQLELLRAPGELYANAPDVARRSFLDAFFSDVLVEIADHEIDVTGDPHAEVAALVEVRRGAKKDETLHEIVEGDAPAADSILRVSGLNLRTVVGIAGFEPTTSSSRTRRATKLRYIPVPARKRAGQG